MKKITFSALACLSLLLAGCESETPFGKCVGVDEVELEDPTLRYKISTTNMVVGVIFFEMVVPPIVIGLDEFYCPVGKK